jgi:hypothetical protein
MKLRFRWQLWRWRQRQVVVLQATTRCGGLGSVGPRCELEWQWWLGLGASNRVSGQGLYRGWAWRAAHSFLNRIQIVARINDFVRFLEWDKTNSVCYDFILNWWSLGELRHLTWAHNLAWHGAGRNTAARVQTVSWGRDSAPGQGIPCSVAGSKVGWAGWRLGHCGWELAQERFR